MKEMGRVYWCHSVGTFGVSLVAIFIPIFLLKTGYSFTTILAYLAGQQLLAAVLQYPATALMRYIRPHSMLIIGDAWAAVMFGLLATLPTHHWPLWLIAIPWALNRVTYWVGFHATFSIARGHKTSTKQIAGINALNILASTGAPAVGGLVATFAGIKYVYAGAVLLLILAILPMMSSLQGPKRMPMKLSWKFVKNMRRDAFANFCNSMVITAESCIWPLFVYLLVSSYAGIGLLSTVIAVASVFFTLYVGKHQKGSNDRRFLRRGVATYGLVSIGRTVAQNTTQIFGLNLFAGLGRSLYVTPFMNRYYANSERISPSTRTAYIATMEVAGALGAAVFLGGTLVASLYFGIKIVLTAAIGLVAFAAFGIRYIR